MRQEFNVHLLNDVGIEKATKIAEIYSRALEDLEALVPAGRERAVMITELQKSAFFAKRGMALDPANQKP